MRGSKRGLKMSLPPATLTSAFILGWPIAVIVFLGASPMA